MRWSRIVSRVEVWALLVTYAALFILLALVSGCSQVKASQSRLAWSVATKYEDGTPLPVTDIAGHAIAWGKRGGPYSAGSALVPMPATAWPLPAALPSGETCFVVRTVLTEDAVTTRPAVRESAASVEACAVVPFVPAAPASVRVE